MPLAMPQRVGGPLASFVEVAFLHRQVEELRRQILFDEGGGNPRNISMVLRPLQCGGKRLVCCHFAT